MKKALWKDAVREIRRSLGRYFSILGIIAVGVGFFAGIRAAGPDMLLTADTYYHDNRLMDVRLVSTMGLTRNDLKEMKNLEDVETAEAAYSADLIRSEISNPSVVRVMSLPASLNELRLLDGRLPGKDDECVVEFDQFKTTGLKIGDTLSLTVQNGDIKDTLKYNEFTITGVIVSPLYVTYDKGVSTAGNGSVAFYAFIKPSAFAYDFYTEIYLRLKSASQYSFETDEYHKAVEDFINKNQVFFYERSLQRTAEIKEEAQKKLDQAKQEAQIEFNKAEQELENARKQLESAQLTLAKSRTAAELQYAQAEQQLAMINSQLPDEQALEDAEALLPSIERMLEAADAVVEASEEAISAYISVTYPEENERISNDTARIEELDAQLTEKEAQLALLEEESEEYKALEAEIRQLRQEKEEVETDRQEAQKDLDEKLEADEVYQRMQDDLKQEKELVQKLNDYYQMIVKGLADLEQFKALKAQLEAVLATKESTFAKLDAAQKEIDDGYIAYEDGMREFKRQKAEAEKEFANAQKEIDDLEKARWYIFDRDDNVGYAEWADNAQRMNAIAAIFPTFFLLIAALVCLTAMTRMVEESRGQIGCYKALGYTSGEIVGKYLLYVGSATVIGSVSGLAIGFKLLPTIIFNAYNIMYRYPSCIAPVQFGYGVLSVLMALLTTLSVTYLSCMNCLKAVPASLMRPLAPKGGKRVLLEKWGWFWRKLSFSYKVTVRNLFRYKKRMAMTIIGIAGCTGLTLTAFGIRDSVNAIGSIQFDDIMRLDAIAVLNTDEDDLEGYLERSKDYPVKEQLLLYSETVKVIGNGEEIETSLTVPFDLNIFEDMTDLRTLNGHVHLDLEDGGAVITEKLSTLAGVKTGDTVQFKAGDKTWSVKVSGVAENYVNHYLYLNPATYKSLTGSEPEANQIYITAKNNTAEGMDYLGTVLVADPEVRAMSRFTTVRDRFEDAISSLNTVVYVLLASACALAFIVLYNLVDINITERKRELATIKVLGFRDGEVTSYLYRENLILTIFGVIAGLLLGTILHRVCMNTLEIDTLLFGKSIYPPSYLYSVVIVMSFSVIVNIFTHFTLKRIDMIESLKSVE